MSAEVSSSGCREARLASAWPRRTPGRLTAAGGSTAQSRTQTKDADAVHTGRARSTGPVSHQGQREANCNPAPQWREVEIAFAGPGAANPTPTSMPG